MLLRGHGTTALITSSLGARHFARGPLESLSGPQVKLTVAPPQKYINNRMQRRDLLRQKDDLIVVRVSPNKM